MCGAALPRRPYQYPPDFTYPIREGFGPMHVRSIASLFLIAVLPLAGCSSDNGPSGPPKVTGAIAISAGGSSSCALGSAGGLACWGQVPPGAPFDTTILGPVSRGAASVPSVEPFTSVAVARTQFSATGCAVSSSDKVYCWGALELDGDGQLAFAPGIAALTGATSASTVSIDAGHFCVTRNDRGVRCYGAFSGGGRGTDSVLLATVDPDASLTPNGLAPTLSAIGTAQGKMFGCALRTDSLVACWGTRHRGQLGGAAGDTVQNCINAYAPSWCQPGPAVIAGGTKYRQISAAYDHACATRITGEVDCWGRKVGMTAPNWALACDPVDNCVNTPTQVPLPGTAIRVTTGEDHACALLTTGAAYCWGSNTHGALGRPGPTSVVPVAVAGGYHFATISAGSAHTCGIESGTGALGCWGSNASGQLGDGTTEDSDHPVAVVAAQ